MTGLSRTTPGRLLDELKEMLLLRSDSALADALGTTPSLISMHEESELSIRELRALNGG